MPEEYYMLKTSKDSVDKIVTAYFRAVTTKAFYYKGKVFTPAALSVSPQIFRGYTCPSGCGGCCSRFSLDYLPHEERTGREVKRIVGFDGRRVILYSDTQMDHTDHHCRNLQVEDGRCGIHGHHPFSCDFELLRSLDSGANVRLTAQLYGRGWNMLRVDRDRGAMCEMTPPDTHARMELLRKLIRLKEWTDHFGLENTRIPAIYEWAMSGPHDTPLFFAGPCPPPKGAMSLL